MSFTDTTRKAENGGSGVTSLTVTLNSTAAGSLIGVGVSVWRSGSPSATITVSDNVNGAYTAAFTYPSIGGASAGIWYFRNGAGGNLTITITPENGFTYDMWAAAHEFSGGDTTTAISGTPSTSTGTSTTASGGTTTPSDADCLMLAIMDGDFVGTISQNAGGEGYILSNENELPAGPGQPGSFVFKILSGGSGSGQSHTWTLGSSSPYSAGIAAFKPAAAGSSTSLTVTEAALTNTGQSVPLDLGLPITNAALSFTGQSVSLFAEGIAVTEATLTLSGQDVQLLANANFTLAVTEATATLSGQDLPFLLNTPWDEAALTLTGQDVTLVAGLPVTLAVTETALTFTGSDVTFFVDVDYILTVTEAALTLTGQDVGVLTAGGALTLVVDTSNLLLSGQDVGVNPSYSLPAQSSPRQKRRKTPIRVNFGR